MVRIWSVLLWDFLSIEMICLSYGKKNRVGASDFFAHFTAFDTLW